MRLRFKTASVICSFKAPWSQKELKGYDVKLDERKESW